MNHSNPQLPIPFSLPARPLLLIAFITALMLSGCGGGGGGGGMISRDTDNGNSMTTLSLANLNVTQRQGILAATLKTADATPRAGSITQSSNAVNNVTQDRISVTTTYGATRNTHTISNGSLSISTDADHYNDIGTSTFRGQELAKRVDGGILFVDAYSDIEAPKTTAGQGESMRLDDVPIGTPVNVSLNTLNARMGPGTLDGVPGTFHCDRGGGNCPVRIVGSSGTAGPAFQGTDWMFTPNTDTTTTTEDTDYLSGGIWLFVPTNATSTDDYAFGAFGDGSDPFRETALPALTGTASYDGQATGIYSAREPDGTEVGYFNADAFLTANFDNDTIDGYLDSFKLEDFFGTPLESPSSNERLTLRSTSIGTSDSGFFTGNLRGSVGETSYTGNWGGQFFGNGDPGDKPGSVAGTFGGKSTDNRQTFVGIFAAYNQ